MGISYIMLGYKGIYIYIGINIMVKGISCYLVAHPTISYISIVGCNPSYSYRLGLVLPGVINSLAKWDTRYPLVNVYITMENHHFLAR